MFETKKSKWQLFQDLENDKSGFGDYLQAELVAVCRAIDILKSLPPSEVITFHKWIVEAVEFANRFPNIGAKYRDVFPYLMSLGDYGLVKIEGDPDSDWDNATVRITAKGYLADWSEYFQNKSKEWPEYEYFDPKEFETLSTNDFDPVELSKCDENDFLDMLKKEE